MTSEPLPPPATETSDHVEGWLPGAEGVALFWQGWVPSRPLRAVVVLAHGGLEHGGRYDDLARRLGRSGIAVYTVDFRGHGRSSGRTGQIGRMSLLVDDLHRLWRHAVDRHPGTPAFLFGHSLGAMVALEYVTRGGSGPAGMVLSGTGIDVSGIPPVQAKMASLLSAVAPNLGLIALDSSGISRDPDVVRAYDEDPLVFRGKVPVRTAAELLKSAAFVGPRLGSVRVPLLVLHGADDVVASPAGARMVHDRAGSTDKTLVIHEGLYHEIFNEPEKDVVIAGVADWVLERS